MGTTQSSNKITSNDKAVLDLKHQRDKLRQYQKRLQVNIDSHSNAAKACLVAGQKSRALTSLRQRKYDEQLLDKTDAQLSILQELLSSIEFTEIQTRVVQSLSNGAAVLKQLQAEISLDKVERVMDRVGEGVAAQREIDEALMSKISPEQEDECLSELAALEREQGHQVAVPTASSATAENPQAPIPVGDLPILPNAPEGEIPTKEEDEEREADARNRERERQKRREEDLHLAMTA